MLRSIYLQNFVCKGTENIKFEEGTYFFIGGNDSGKNNVFNAVQQCLTQERSLDDEFVLDWNKPSSILCSFDIHGPDSKNYSKAYIVFGKYGHSNKKILARIIALVGKQSEIAIDGPVSLYLKGNAQAFDEPCRSLLTLLQEEREDYAQSISSVLSSFPNSMATRKGTLSIRNNYKAMCRKLFSFVVIYSTQGLLCQTQTESGFSLVKHLPDILRHLLKQKLEFDKDKESRYFEMLTNYRKIEISLEEDNLHVFEDSIEHGTEFLSSEIVGAKIYSLLLSTETFHTILIENGGKYLDPASIRMLREEILPEQSFLQKTVIMTSNRGDFISSWTFPRTFLFRQRISSILAGSCLAKQEASSTTLARLADGGQISQIIYAEKVFLVEEKSEYLFLEQLFWLILNDDKHVLNMLSMISSKEKDQEATQKSLKRFISSLALVEAGDLNNMYVLRKMCQRIGVKCFCLDNRSGQEAKRSKIVTRQGTTASDIFVWKCGSLENMLYAQRSQVTKTYGSAELHAAPSILSKLKAQKVDLEGIMHEKNRKRRLYDNPKLTYDNIKKSVQICLQACQNKSQAIAEFIQFLIHCS